MADDRNGRNDRDKSDATDELETRLARIIEHHLQHGALPSAAEIAPDRPDLAAPLLELAHRYLDVTRSLDEGGATAPSAGEDGATGAGTTPGREPSIDGFRTIERLGAGGMGEVYKLEDLRLGRIVAAKVVRRDRDHAASGRLAEFLREAKSLALFSDPRIVQIFEFRADADPPVIIMEFVDGFELGRLGPSLEFRQRAKILREVADAIARAHALGIQHRDLKPSNIMLDGQLAPKILDFGLSGGDPATGHLRGTLAYIAPEQLDPSQPIDARTDVYALGVTLYELLTGVAPFAGESDEAMIAAIREARPRLPIEVDPAVPEGLQAIALKAMERRPADRYPSAREMALDLDRYLDGRPVTARPTQYASTLAARVQPHVDQIAEWQRVKLIYPHEAERIQSAYRSLEAREDDWIVASRMLSYSQIALYLGAFLLFLGSAYYFADHRLFGVTSGVLEPFLVLAAPFAGLNLAGRWLYRRQHQAVAVAFYLAGVGLLPLFLLIWLPEAGLFVAAPDAPHQLIDGGTVSNRQLQLTILVASVWAGWLALRTGTTALSAVSTLLLFLLAIAILGDFGLRSWIEQEEFHRLALHLFPLVPAYVAAGLVLERGGRAWFARPLYIAGGLTLVAVLDLLALDGKMFLHLGFSLQSLQGPDVSSATLLDQLAALSLNGVVFYLVGLAIERRGTPGMAPAAQLFFIIAPFSTLEPLAYLSGQAEYPERFDWFYLALAVTIAVLSHQRQRKSFYYAGVINTGLALHLVAVRQEWIEQPSWAIALVLVGLATLAAGFALDAIKRRRTA